MKTRERDPSLFGEQEVFTNCKRPSRIQKKTLFILLKRDVID